MIDSQADGQVRLARLPEVGRWTDERFGVDWPVYALSGVAFIKLIELAIESKQTNKSPCHFGQKVILIVVECFGENADSLKRGSLNAMAKGLLYVIRSWPDEELYIVPKHFALKAIGEFGMLCALVLESLQEELTSPAPFASMYFGHPENEPNTTEITPPRPSSNEDRDRWIYDKKSEGLSWAVVTEKLELEARVNKWEPLERDGVRKAYKRFCLRLRQ